MLQLVAKNIKIINFIKLYKFYFIHRLLYCTPDS